MNQKLRDELLAMKERDEQVRARLADEGSLSDGYHADMEAVQCRNAAWLVEIIEAFGGPGLSLVGCRQRRGGVAHRPARDQ